MNNWLMRDRFNTMAYTIIPTNWQMHQQQLREIRELICAHLGFSARGNMFMDADIPHIEMWHFSQEANKSL